MRLQANFKQFYWFFHTLQFPKDYGMGLFLMIFEKTMYMLKKNMLYSSLFQALQQLVFLEMNSLICLLFRILTI